MKKRIPTPTIPEIWFVPQPTTKEAEAILEHGFSRIPIEWEPRCKIGGNPDWIQSPNVPYCPEC